MNLKPTFLESLHHVPDPAWAGMTYGIVRAGKVIAGQDYRIIRDRHVGQDILYCVRGRGRVETLGQDLEISAGEMTWIANELPHAHYADPSDPWTLLWFRLDGPNPIFLRQRLFRDGVPRVAIPDRLHLNTWFEKLFLAMREGATGLEFQLNHLVGEFLTITDIALRANDTGVLPPQLHAAIEAMRVDLSHPWDSDDLSALTKLSAPHVRRLFKKHLRISPHQWLLRERLTHAQTLMTDSATPLGEIADICGFCDVYHFTREFKRSIGTPPAAWRRNELGRRHRT